MKANEPWWIRRGYKVGDVIAATTKGRFEGVVEITALGYDWVSDGGFQFKLISYAGKHFHGATKIGGDGYDCHFTYCNPIKTRRIPKQSLTK